MATLFISDLHLDPSRPAICEYFVGFLKQHGGNAEALYILGDLFDAWIGDDDPEPLWQQIIQALFNCVSAGTPIYLIHGNRDFLIGERFQQRSQCQLIDDPTIITLYGQRILLMHGDLLCSDDTEYQLLRKQVRDPRWQEEVLKNSVETRLTMARQAREQSAMSILGKSDDIMDVNQHTVEHYMQTSNADLLIHGHTHRPGTHSLTISGATAKRVVLGDWYQHGNLLILDKDRLDFLELPCPAQPLG
ncbi:UDP-2,3-diacylglucosamine diphosphatase [hydrothermal vent metagenome]|uniref:UDP-2,3-diacylglucosamine diphosphatase n=1 Tax=hydrothermal vent metagenome TaxID=652676 RepID=A0A3B0YUD5_9ZZZZ